MSDREGTAALWSSELDVVGMPAVGRCEMRFAGIIERAVAIEIVEIDRRRVTIRYWAGDDGPDEVKLRRGERMEITLHVKSAQIGAER